MQMCSYWFLYNRCMDRIWAVLIDYNELGGFSMFSLPESCGIHPPYYRLCAKDLLNRIKEYEAWV